MNYYAHGQFVDPWLTREELAAAGLRAGDNALVSRSAILINPQRIELGSHLRIDAGCMISAGSEGISIGNFVHLGGGVSLLGSGGRIRLDDFAGIAASSVIYTTSHDYREGWLTGPLIPIEFCKTVTGPVTLRRHAVIGSGSVILPGVTLGIGCSVGALSLVKQSVALGAVVAGNPSKTIGERDVDRLMSLEETFLARHR